MKRGVIWYAYDAQAVAAEVIGAGDAERLAFFDGLQRALLKQERGINPCADSMLDERERYLNLKSEGGKKGMASRWGDKSLITHLQGTNKSPVTTDTDTDTTKQNKKKKPTEPDTDKRAPAQDADGDAGEVGSVGLALNGEGEPGEGRANGDGNASGNYPQGAIDGFRKASNRGQVLRALPAESVIRCMLDYCGEANPKAAASGLVKQRKRLGDTTFKNVCAEFVDGIESGADPEPGNRGAALMARLKDATPGADCWERKRGRPGLRGSGGPQDVTIRGVRVANKGDDLGDWGK